MRFSWDLPYPSQRMPILARNVVATSQPLAAQAGLSMLRQGGNAVDAALATAMALTVVEPTSNGLGGDALALIWDGQQLHGFNGSGRAPQAWSPQRFAGLPSLPVLGWGAVTVPGAVDAWVQLAQRFARMPLSRLIEPAMVYAQDGFLVSPKTALRWAEAPELYGELPEFRRTFLPGGRAPRAGQRFCCPEQAATLQRIAESKGEAFYRGRLARRMARCAADQGGAMTEADLAQHRGEWVLPLAVDYRGVCLHELPPNCQGIAALMALGILKHFELARHPVDSPESLHLQIEAMKLAFAQVQQHVADPRTMTLACEALLDPAFLARQAGALQLDRAARPARPLRPAGSTVYLAAADAGGMMVSYIQSNYLGFGSGVVVPGTGICLHNRGLGFVLEPGHPNCVDGGKRPFHTIIPAFVTIDGRPCMSLGVMGAHMQPQGHVQMMVRIFDYGQNPQAACDAPRWYVDEDFKVALEPGFPAGVPAGLADRGHRLLPDPPEHLFGGGQLIYRLDDGYLAASDPRKDGQAVGF